MKLAKNHYTSKPEKWSNSPSVFSFFYDRENFIFLTNTITDHEMINAWVVYISVVNWLESSQNRKLHTSLNVSHYRTKQPGQPTAKAIFLWHFQGHELQKTVFVVFFHGEQIKLRVRKVCHGFQATPYPCPATYKEQQEMLAGIETRIKDLEMVMW